jgi:hypothetical protein
VFSICALYLWVPSSNVDPEITILQQVCFVLHSTKWYLMCKGAWVLWWLRGQAVLGGREVVLDRHSDSILGWVRLRSCRHPGNLSTITCTALDFWNSFPIDLYWYNLQPQNSSADWLSFLCLIFQPNMRPFIFSRKQSHRHKTIFVLVQHGYNSSPDLVFISALSGALVSMLPLILSSFLHSVEHWF